MDNSNIKIIESVDIDVSSYGTGASAMYSFAYNSGFSSIIEVSIFESIALFKDGYPTGELIEEISIHFYSETIQFTYHSWCKRITATFYICRHTGKVVSDVKDHANTINRSNYSCLVHGNETAYIHYCLLTSYSVASKILNWRFLESHLQSK